MQCYPLIFGKELLCHSKSYSNDPEKDYPDEVIIANWLKKKEKEQALQLI